MLRIPRRLFLKGAGVALALPLLIDRRPLQSAQRHELAPKRRMVLINLEFGLHAPNLFPQEAGRNYELTPYLEILKNFRTHFTIISGTSHPGVDGGHTASKSFLTAAPRPSSATFKNSISLDQLASEKLGAETRFSSLPLSLTPGRGLSYSRSGVELPSEDRPSRLFARLFLDGTPDEQRRQLQRLKDGKSVLDAVLDQARAMRPRLGSTDRQKLDQYFTAVRSTESRLSKWEAWQQTPKPKVDAQPPKDIANNADVLGRARLMFDMVHHALHADSTRLITLYMSGVNAVPPVHGVTQDYHNLSHHGQDPSRLAELKVIELAQLSVFAEFLEKLQSVTEDGETLLDRTMVLFGSNLGNASSHDNRNLPVILAGGGFRHGNHLAFNPVHNYPLSNLFVTMLQRLGLESDAFGSSTGTMTGLEP